MLRKHFLDKSILKTTPIKVSQVTEMFYLRLKIWLKIISSVRGFHTARLTFPLNSRILLTFLLLVVQLKFDKQCSLLGNWQSVYFLSCKHWNDQLPSGLLLRNVSHFKDHWQHFPHIVNKLLSHFTSDPSCCPPVMLQNKLFSIYSDCQPKTSPMTGLLLGFMMLVLAAVSKMGWYIQCAGGGLH